MLYGGLVDVLHLPKPLKSTHQPQAVEIYRQVRTVEGHVSDSFALPFNGLIDILHLPKLLKSNQQRIPKVVETVGKLGLSRGTSCTAWLCCMIASSMSFTSPNRSNRTINEFPKLLRYIGKSKLSGVQVGQLRGVA